ncbi:MAG: hypothetical protein A2046_00520 [Bacteroidetes bacterium GWA2_30_7]|nr:MAG: hypothetical protein A2046_00520 [Bacteroidetes bacterium GWA2_30_7]
MKTLYFILIIVFVCVKATFAQDTTSTERNQQNVSKSSSKFLLTGYGFSGYRFTQIENESESTFGETGFNPIFLWSPTNKLFFESELEFELEGNEVNFELEYANVSYILNKYITLSMGKFLSPFGTFQERLHPAWINKFVDKPMGFDHGAVGPGTEIGFEIRGGISLGSSKMNYSLYISNGPSLNTGTSDTMMAGVLEYENFEDNNSNKAVGGRIGFLPLSNSSLELGISGQTGVVGASGDSIYEDTKATLFSIDFSYVQPLKFMKCNLDIKGQYSQVDVDKKDYSDPMDPLGTMTYTFDNTSQTYYVQAALRASMLDNSFFRNVELVGRYSSLTLPEGAKWGEEEMQTTIGLNYWLSWSSVLKFNYQIIEGHEGELEKAFLIQWAIGF